MANNLSPTGLPLCPTCGRLASQHTSPLAHAFTALVREIERDGQVNEILRGALTTIRDREAARHPGRTHHDACEHPECIASRALAKAEEVPYG